MNNSSNTSSSICALSFAAVVFTLMIASLTAASSAQVRVAITVGPPPLPVYEQPICPGDGYLWTPGYWAYDYDDTDYYWVPGTWIMAPEVGFLWTPGYWGWGGEAFIFHEGYWGPHVGFYGGVAYGFGYFGVGFEGGRWDNGHFFYNRSVTNVNVTVIHNVYNKTVINNTNNRVSFNGGNGGINARPTREEETVEHERHVAPVAAQTQHEQAARSDPQQRASVNHGKPMVAATPKPGDLRNGGVPAREAEGPENRDQSARPENNVAKPANIVHPNDLPARDKAPAPNTGNPKLDKKYQQQQDKLAAQQDKERQKLQQQQDKEHQKMAKQNTDNLKQQQLEQRHQQQTQQLQEKHQQQQQHLQERQPQPASGRPPR